jgi:Ca-activated chloride channel family protein
MEKSNVEIESKTRFQDQFMYFVAAALLLLLFEFILRYLFLRTFP